MYNQKVINNIEAVIFDMDGLMIDSEPLQSLSFELLVKQYGKTPIPYKHGLMQMVGVGGEKNYIMIKKRHQIDEDIEILRKKRRAIYYKILQEKVTALPGLFQLLKTLKREQLKIAIASSAPREEIVLVIKKLKISQFFDVLVSGFEVKRHKPFPDIYLKAAQELKLNTSYCLALEDSEIGVQAALGANMKVIAVPSQFTKDHNFGTVNKIVNSLEEVTINLIKTL